MPEAQPIAPARWPWLACLLLVACSAYDASLMNKPPQSREDGGSDELDAGPLLTPDAAILTSCEGAEDYSICSGPSSQGVCISGECTIIHCLEGHFDCDGDAHSGCEETLSSSSNCRACGARCALKHVRNSVCQPEASGGPCLIDHGCQADELGDDCRQSSAAVGCEDGWGDCDGIDANGCETSLRSTSNCGGCGTSCELTSGEASCESGECKFVACKPTFADCGGGCIGLSDNAQHCGACNKPCAAPNTCAGGRCSTTQCASNKADCDENAANGCEVDLTTANDCGNCGVKCGPYAHAQAGCTTGQCTIASCNAGHADCDGKRDTGCETDLSRVDDCGSCGNDCAALPRVTGAQCNAGTCTGLICESGWGNCDGRTDNGCEQPLNTNDHCGSCSGTCNPAHAAGSCSTGSCKIASCETGYDDCAGGVGDGCEAALDGNANCGTCGNTCPSGQTCRNGGCACSSGACSQGTECCGGACIDTNSECVPWPCIPGTARDKNNCGGCGISCAGWCCVAF